MIMRHFFPVILALKGVFSFATGAFTDDGSGVVHVKTLDGEDVFKVDFVQATFGPDLSDDESFVGRAYVPDPPDACTKVSPFHSSAIKDNYAPVALVIRKSCNFEVKVLNAQKAGYKAVIVIDNKPGELPFAMGYSNASLVNQINISSLMIGYADGITMNNSYVCQPSQLNLCRYYVSLQASTRFLDPSTILVPMAIAFACILFITVGVVIVRWIREVRRRRKSRVSKSQLKKIPCRKFKKGDTYDACAICLDDYNEGDKLRILPCSHAYHVKCIDPWLLKNKRTCPVCKRTAVPGDPASDDSGTETRERATVEPTERTPLLPPPAGARRVETPSATAADTSQSDDHAGNQPAPSRFYGSGLPLAFENEVVLSSSSEDECDVGAGSDSLCLLRSSRSSSRAPVLSCEVSVGSVSINADPPSEVEAPSSAAPTSDEQIASGAVQA